MGMKNSSQISSKNVVRDTRQVSIHEKETCKLMALERIQKGAKGHLYAQHTNNSKKNPKITNI